MFFINYNQVLYYYQITYINLSHHLIKLLILNFQNFNYFIILIEQLFIYKYIYIYFIHDNFHVFKF